MLSLGFQETDLTPASPMQMIGFAQSGLSQGVERPLRAQVSLWQLEETRCALVAIDHIGFGLEHAASLRARLAALLHSSPEQVMLCFSHTHAAPNDSLEATYAAWADERIVSAASEALQNMRPVRIAWGCGEVDIGVNRRNGEAVDRRAGLLKATDATTGEPVLAVVRLTAHCNALKGDNARLSPDWFGATRDLLSARWGCPAMLTQGASGNIAPRFFSSRIDPPDADDSSGRFIRTDAALKEMARAVLQGLDPLFHRLTPHDAHYLRMSSVHDTLHAPVPTPERAREIAEEARREAGIDGEGWLREVARLHAEGVLCQDEPVEVQCFQLDEGSLLGVPNEILCELALRVREQAGELTFLGGYTNGCSGYLPTAEEYDRGGYEVFWSMLDFYMYFHRVMPLARDSADRLVLLALRCLCE